MVTLTVPKQTARTLMRLVRAAQEHWADETPLPLPHKQELEQLAAFADMVAGGEPEDELRHDVPSTLITPAVEQFVHDHSNVVGFEAWQTYHDTVGTDVQLAAFKEVHDRSAWNAVATAVLEDFAVWYDSGHFRQAEEEDTAQ